MFFYLSKILWTIAQPGNLLLIALLFGVLMLGTRRWRSAGRRIVGVVAVVGAVLAVMPFGAWLIAALEDRFPIVSEMPSQVDGIIVLGGVVDPSLTESRGQVAIGDAVERLMAFASLARRYPDAKLVFSGGSGSLRYQDLKEARYVDPVLRDLGLDGGRVLFEGQSRNTFENAVLSRKVADPKPGGTWILITSAFHMPRAVGSFRAQGWTVLPYPVDYNTLADQGFEVQFNFSGGLRKLGHGLHEWLGLAMYRLTGKTNTFFPGPDSGPGR